MTQKHSKPPKSQARLQANLQAQAKTKVQEKLQAKTQPKDQYILEVEGVSLTHRSQSLVNNVSLVVNAGEIVGLLGPNGAGKSTLFSLICGLRRPDSGKIIFKQQDVSKILMHGRARLGLGYLPQDSSLFVDLTTAENIQVMLELSGCPRSKRKQAIEKSLREFGLWDRRDVKGAALSGGERRRAEIARAFILNPDLMLLDEPFAGVDPIATGELKQIAKKLSALGLAVLITDHNARDCLSLVDRVYVISSGSIIACGTPKEVAAQDDVRRNYLGEDFRLS